MAWVKESTAMLLCCTALATYAADTGTTFTPPPNRRGQSAWIAMRHQRQEKNLCVPTSASIILDYFGDSISPREIKALSRSRTYAPGDPFSDFTDTYFRDLIAGLARRGYDWREKDYPLSGKGLKTGLTEIERSLDAGIPVMIDTSPDDGGHTFVVAGYSVADRALFAVDPNKPYPGLRVVGFPELEGVWNSLAAALVFERRCSRNPEESPSRVMSGHLGRARLRRVPSVLSSPGLKTR